MQLLPEQIAKALVNECFYSRRTVVAIFVIVNVLMLIGGLLWPKVYTASTSILVAQDLPSDGTVVPPSGGVREAARPARVG